MKWKIITDSSCNLEIESINSEIVEFRKVPFKINFGNKDFTDDENIDLSNLVNYMEYSNIKGMTACPSIGEWSESFGDSENIIIITISANLSGSYNSATAARNIELATNQKRNILVINSGSAGPALDLLVIKAEELIGKKMNFTMVEEALTNYCEEIHTIFALSSFNNLVASGRMSRFTAFLAGKLSIWGVGEATENGMIGNIKKMRGTSKVIQSFIKELESRNFNSGSVIINHCDNKELALKVKYEILKIWNGSKVEVLPMRGLCTYYAERNGLMLAF